jgi:hypothetical protein
MSQVLVHRRPIVVVLTLFFTSILSAVKRHCPVPPIHTLEDSASVLVRTHDVNVQHPRSATADRSDQALTPNGQVVGGLQKSRSCRLGLFSSKVGHVCEAEGAGALLVPWYFPDLSASPIE